MVPAYNEEDVVDDTLSHLAEVEDFFDDVFFVDDGSSDSTADRVKKFLDSHESGIRFLQLKKNTNKVGAIKKAVERSESDKIVLMDADTRIEDPEKLSEAERVMDEEGRKGLAFKVVPDLGGSWKDRIWAYLQDLDYGLGRIFHLYTSSDRLRLGSQRTVRCVPGAGGMYDRKALLKAFKHHSGRHSGDDMELTAIIQFEFGGRITLFDEVRFVTHVPKDYLSLFKQRKRWSKGMFQSFDFQREGFASEIKRMSRIGQIAAYDLFLVALAFIILFSAGVIAVQGGFLQVFWLIAQIYLMGSVLFLLLGSVMYYKKQHEYNKSLITAPLLPIFRFAVFFPPILSAATEYAWERIRGKGPTEVVEAEAEEYRPNNSTGSREKAGKE